MNLHGDSIQRLSLRGTQACQLSRHHRSSENLDMKTCLLDVNDFNIKQSCINKPTFDIPYLFDSYQRHYGGGGQSQFCGFLEDVDNGCWLDTYCGERYRNPRLAMLGLLNYCSQFASP